MTASTSPAVTGTPGGGRRWLRIAALATVVLAVGGAAAILRGPLTGRATRPSPVWVNGVAEAPPGASELPVAPVTDLAPGAPAPTRVRIPAIGVNAALEELRLDGTGALLSPNDFAKAGWYADGTSPGQPGPAVIAGHVDSTTGRAVFYRLPELRPGDTVEVARGHHWVTFRVTSSAWYPKSRFPTAEVYGPTPDPQLRLITCGGNFDRTRRSYVDNLVVYAVAG
jgi:hypothetical protein